MFQNTWLIDKPGTPPALERQDSVDFYLNLADEDGRLSEARKARTSKLLSCYGLESALDPEARVWQWVLTSDLEKTAPEAESTELPDRHSM